MLVEGFDAESVRLAETSRLRDFQVADLGVLRHLAHLLALRIEIARLLADRLPAGRELAAARAVVFFLAVLEEALLLERAVFLLEEIVCLSDFLHAGSDPAFAEAVALLLVDALEPAFLGAGFARLLEIVQLAVCLDSAGLLLAFLAEKVEAAVYLRESDGYSSLIVICYTVQCIILPVIAPDLAVI